MFWTYIHARLLQLIPCTRAIRTKFRFRSQTQFTLRCPVSREPLIKLGPLACVAILSAVQFKLSSSASPPMHFIATNALLHPFLATVALFLDVVMCKVWGRIPVLDTEPIFVRFSRFASSDENIEVHRANDTSSKGVPEIRVGVRNHLGTSISCHIRWSLREFDSWQGVYFVQCHGSSIGGALEHPSLLPLIDLRWANNHATYLLVTRCCSLK